jgi:mercuric ion transport protein
MCELKEPAAKSGFWFLLAGMITAVGASLCCLAPLILLALGIGSAYLGFLTVLVPYRPLFIGATLLILTLAFHRIYFTPKVRRPGLSRPQPNGIKRQPVAFWIVSALALCLIALPWLIPLLYVR